MKFKAENITSNEMVKVILDSLVSTNEYLNTIDEGSFEYENICENVQDQFSEIYEFLNIHLMSFNNHNFFIADLMNFKMWDYLREEVAFDSLIDYLNSEYSKRI